MTIHTEGRLAVQEYTYGDIKTLESHPSWMPVRYPRGDAEKMHAISPLDTRKKFTLECDCCLTVIPSGEEPSTGEEISAVAHAAPGSVMYNCGCFRDELAALLEELDIRTSQGKREVAVLAGRVGHERRNYEREYKESLLRISLLTQKILGIAARVIHPPKKAAGPRFTHVFYDTPERTVLVATE